jgi:hypothetical protein
MKIVDYRTRQKGYGRQALYVDVKTETVTIHNVYVCDVFPNVQEHFDFILWDEAVEVDEGYFTDSNGNGEYNMAFETKLDAVRHFINVDELVI